MVGYLLLFVVSVNWFACVSCLWFVFVLFNYCIWVVYACCMRCCFGGLRFDGFCGF